MRKHLPKILLALSLLAGMLVYAGNSAKKTAIASKGASSIASVYVPGTIDRSGEIELTFTHSVANSGPHIAIKKIPGQGSMSEMPAFSLHKTVMFVHNSLHQRRAPVHLQLIFPFHYFP